MQESTGSKILVVEDDPRMCESIRHLLSFSGYDVRTSRNLFDALNSLLAMVFDVVLLDLTLEDQNGFIVMDYLSLKKLDTHVIVITGQQSEESAITALRKGAIDYLKKPVHPDVLLKSVARVLNMRENRRTRERLNQVIVSSRERFRCVVDTQKDYLCRLNRDFAVTFANKALADAFHTTPREMIGRPFTTLVQDSIQSTLLNRLEAIRSGSRPIRIEVKFNNSNGHRRCQRWRFQGVLDERGRVVEIQCTGRDVTLEKIILQQVEEKTEKFRHLAEITSDWIWEVDHRGVYTYASPVVYDLLGYLPDEVVGKRPFDFMPVEEGRRFEAVFKKILHSGEPFKTIETINLHKNGTMVTLESSGVPIIDGAGAVVGYRGVDRNISARKQAEQLLHEETRKLQQALAKVNRLSGMLPICASCKKIRDDSGYWNQIESYIADHSEAEFSHGICPDCVKKLYSELFQNDDTP